MCRKRKPAQQEQEIRRKRRIPPKSWTKTGNFISTWKLTRRGKDGERWFIDGVQVTQDPTTGKTIVMKNGPEGLYYRDYKNAEFPGFSWISQANYIAFQRVGKARCYVFRQEYTNEDGTSVTTAAIDSETQLPVLLDDDGYRTVYEFSPPPQVMPVVPEKVKVLLAPPVSSNAPVPRSMRKEAVTVGG